MIQINAHSFDLRKLNETLLCEVANVAPVGSVLEESRVCGGPRYCPLCQTQAQYLAIISIAVLRIPLPEAASTIKDVQCLPQKDWFPSYL